MNLQVRVSKKHDIREHPEYKQFDKNRVTMSIKKIF